MPDPADQGVRDRFIGEVDRNFSLIAPAGTGKTNSIARRVLELARQFPGRLPRLVVVTYTNKAAEEMRQRVAVQAGQEGLDDTALRSLDEVFFGTIHAFCTQLLRACGDRIGLRPGFELLTDHREAWGRFLVSEEAEQCFSRHRAELAEIGRFIAVERLFEKLQEGERLPSAGEVMLPEAPDWRSLLDPSLVEAARSNSRPGIKASQERARAWGEALESGAGYLPLPECSTSARDFAQAWQTVFGPFASGLRSAAEALLARISDAFTRWRVGEGLLTYDDQVQLAGALFQDPVAARWIAAQEHIVILDEAQDTDPLQFDFLLRVAGSEDPERIPPPPGRFSMVGDPQQSIYGSRADLAKYLACSSLLGEGAELALAVTFRCSREVIRGVNRLGPELLTGADGQAAFVPIGPRAGAPAGGLWRLVVTGEAEAASSSTAEKEALGCERLARFLATQSPEELGARCWGEVAVIPPRKGSLDPIRAALAEVGLRSQIHSETRTNADDPAYAWLAALLRVAACPDDAWQLYGLLREAFGISDDALRRFGSLSIATSVAGPGPVGEALRLLHEAREAVQRLPLADAVRQLVERIDLAGRLHALPGDDPEALGESLQRLLAVAADAEARRLTLLGWADELARGFDEKQPGRQPDEDAVQLIGAHKSKGSEWDCVLVPFFARPIYFGKETALIPSAFDAEQAKALAYRRRRQETERLLYVTLTRARNQLLLLDDRLLFPPGKSGGLYSYADLTGPEWLDSIAEIGEESSSARRGTISGAAKRVAVPAPAFSPARVQAHATRFPRRLLPHELAVDAPAAEAEPARRREEDFPLDNPGIRYGNWWHETMERLPWGSGPQVCRSAFEESLPDCPDPGRGAEEFATLLRSELGGRLCGDDLAVYPEMPFLHPVSEAEVLQGVIDLVIRDPSGWTVLDWKTNRVAEASALTERYAPQIRAYAGAVAAVIGQPVRAGIWSTALGVWMEID